MEFNEELVEPRSRRQLFAAHGESGGKKVTLLGAADTETVTELTGDGRYRRQVIEALGALVGGEHLADADDEMFMEAFVEIDSSARYTIRLPCLEVPVVFELLQPLVLKQSLARISSRSA